MLEFEGMEPYLWSVVVTPAHMNTSPPPHPLSPQPQRPGDFAMPPPTGTWVQTDSYASGASTVTPYTQQHIPTGLNIISGNPGDPNYQRVDNWRQMSSSAVPSQVPFAAPPTTSATPTRQSPATIMADSLLRIKVKWDGSTLPVKINLNASGDALVAQLQSTFSKRALDRTAFQLRLSTNRDPNAADADEVLVSFNEAELQGDWQDAVAWTKEQTTSSIYGKIEPVDNPG